MATSMTPQEAILAKMVELEGFTFKPDEDIEWGPRDAKIMVPSRFDDLIEYGQAMIALGNAQDEETQFDHVFNYRPGDVVVSGLRAFNKRFGLVQGSRPWWQDAATKEVKVGFGEVEVVPWGDWFTIPGLKNISFYFDEVQSPTGPLGRLLVRAKRRQVVAVQSLFSMVETWLKEQSIYRGKAIDGQVEPDFIDLSGVDPSKLVYNEDVRSDLMAKVLVSLMYPEAVQAEGESLKQAILLDGEWGTGKTEFIVEAMQTAVANGWTAMSVKAGRDNLLTAIETAGLYQKCLVAYEDLDTFASAGETATTMSAILDRFDGATAKGAEVMVIMTTNHIEKIHKGMMRPGRINHHIVVEKPNDDSIKRLVEVFIDGDRLRVQGDEQWNEIVEAMRGMIPAFVKQACSNAKLNALGRNGGKEGGPITGQDIAKAARALARHRAAMDAAQTEVQAPTLDTAFAGIIGGEVKPVANQIEENINTYIGEQASAISSNVDYEAERTRQFVAELAEEQ